MRKRHHLFRFSLLLGWMLLIGGVGMVVQHPIAHAAAFLPPGYSLTVTESASTITYGDTAPDFQAQLTVPAGENPLTNPALFNFVIGSQDFGYDGSTSSGSTYTFTLRGRSVATLPAGQLAVVAHYFSIPLNETLESAPITLTVQKFTLTVDCMVSLSVTLAANAPVTFTMYSSSGPTVDWQDATYTITFVGPQTFTESNLSADNGGQGAVSTPPAPGKYRYQCSFNGTGNFNPAQTPLSGSTIVVSAGNQPTIKLYSNPTTINAGQSATLDIVVSGARGTPTGVVSLRLGPMYTNATSLGGDGSLVVQVTFPSPLPSTTLQVNYGGDPVYAPTTAQFSLTNPPIPGGSNPPNPNPTSPPTNAATATPGTGSTSTPGAGSTATPASSSTPAASSTSIANGGTSSGSHPTDATSNQGTLVFWIVLVVLLILAAGGSGVFIVLRKRARVKAVSAPALATLPFSEDGEHLQAENP